MTGDLFGAAAAAPPVERWADIGGPGGEYRWTLGRRWDDRPMMMVIGHNPSTADATQDDPTVRRWMHFAALWGHGGVVAVNIYPFRSTDVLGCRRWRAFGGKMVDEVLSQNYDAIAAERIRCNRVVACWGALADDRADVLLALRGAVVSTWVQPIYCFGVTADGSPKHVMARGKHRVPNDQQPIEYTPRVTEKEKA